jgi:hypothetical protein
MQMVKDGNQYILERNHTPASEDAISSFQSLLLTIKTEGIIATLAEEIAAILKRAATILEPISQRIENDSNIPRSRSTPRATPHPTH